MESNRVFVRWQLMYYGMYIGGGELSSKEEKMLHEIDDIFVEWKLFRR